MPLKKVHIIFLNILLFQNTFFFLREKLAILTARGIGPSSSIVDASSNNNTIVFLQAPLTLKGRRYFTNEKYGGGGVIMAPTFISARSYVKRLIFLEY